MCPKKKHPQCSSSLDHQCLKEAFSGVKLDVACECNFLKFSWLWLTISNAENKMNIKYYQELKISRKNKI